MGLLGLVAVRALFKMGQAQGKVAAAITLPGV